MRGADNQGRSNGVEIEASKGKGAGVSPRPLVSSRLEVEPTLGDGGETCCARRRSRHTMLSFCYFMPVRLWQ